MNSDTPKYRSKLERLVGGLLGPLWAYEPFKVPYVTYRNYHPDFVYESRGDLWLLVEVKGFFRVGDTQKYKAIRDSLRQENGRDHPRKELVFFLQSSRTKVRKGAKMNMGQWCDKEGFPWFDSVEQLKEFGETIHGHI
jgi:hypothetical protein